MLESSRYIRITIGALITLVIIGYAFIKSINLILGPEISVTTPINGETVHSPLLTISGSAKNIAFLTLDDRQIFVDDAGQIYDQLLLYEGYNVITLRAKDKFGREREVVREIIYSPVKNSKTN